MTPLMDARRRPRSERGFALIEVIVSAAVLALIALAVLSGIDGAMSSTGREKARSVAAALAEKDQERLRTMPVEQLATYGVVNTPIGVDGANYNVQSKVEWVRDSTGGTVSCANDTDDADYLHITSVVTSNVVGAQTAPVQIDSIVAPNVEYSTTHGSLAIKVVSAAGQPQPNVPVTATGPVTLNGSTNEQGCALFQMIPAGDYTVQLNGPGMVDRFGNPTPTQAVTVPAGQLITATFEYDFAGSAAVTIESYKPGTSTVINSAATRLSGENGDEPSLLRNEPQAGPAASPQASFTVNSLYPFAAAYSFYTGTCRYSNPTFNDANPGYFGTYPGSVAVPPGTPVTLNVRQPALNLRLQYYRKSGGNPVATPNNMVVRAYPKKDVDDDCVEPYIPLTTFTPTSTGYGTVGRSLQGGGAYVEAGLPFGTYAFCFQRTSPSTSYIMYPNDFPGETSYDNRAPLGRPTLNTLTAASLAWRTTGGSGAGNLCPNTWVVP